MAQRVKDGVAANGGRALVGAAAVVDRAVGRRRGARRGVGHRVEQPDPLEGDAEHGGTGSHEASRRRSPPAPRRRSARRRAGWPPSPVRAGPPLGRLRRAALERLTHLLGIHLRSFLPPRRRLPADRAGVSLCRLGELAEHRGIGYKRCSRGNRRATGRRFLTRVGH